MFETSYGYAVTGGGSADTVTYKISGTLPQGLSFNQSTGALSGTVTNVSTSNQFFVTAQSSSLGDSEPLTVT
ncbi:hypothetical protein FACS1894166_09140 [Bacilli bacterium]|nr:hypothetical protein FACS1894166_09140 [Bacilli bacterium]